MTEAPSASPRRRVATSAVVVLALAAFGWATWRSFDRAWAPVVVPADFATGVEESFGGEGDLVVDALAGHRARRDHVEELLVTPWGADGSAAETVRRRCNNLGLCRQDDLPRQIDGPRVLLLGDGQLMGVVPNEDNGAALLERALRRHRQLDRATVLNAATARYGLFHDLLRARSLLPVFRPEILLVVCSTGDDFKALDDETLPHITDALSEAGPAPADAAAAARGTDETERRRQRLALGDGVDAEGLCAHGLDQAAWLHLEPGRRRVLADKTGVCLERADELARGYGAHLLVVLLPSFDLLFYDELKARSPFAKEVIESGAQRAWYDELARILRDRGIAWIDLLPAFSAYGRTDLFTSDGQLWQAGHRILAREVEGRVLRILSL